MLFHLSSSLQKVAEREKAALARELHDELGGLLVATKIDVSWLRKRVDDGSDRAKLRWERVLRCMDEGLALKRRVIESLRPTLLDNVGLVAALRWLVDETLRRGRHRLRGALPGRLPELSPDARIAVFRAVQECLMNVVKHAKAKAVLLMVTMEDDQLSVVVRDDGVGIDEGRIETPQSHGLLGMRHRIESLDGKLSDPVARAERGHGVPVSRCRSNASAAQGRNDEITVTPSHCCSSHPRARCLRSRAGTSLPTLRRAGTRPPTRPAASRLRSSRRARTRFPSEPPSYEVSIASAAADHNKALERCTRQPEAVRTQCEQEANAAFADAEQNLEPLRGNQQ